MNMTYEEAGIVIECMLTNIVGDFADKEMPKGAKHTFDALEKAKEALAMAGKYRWHDLRKNPDDLPAKEEEVLVVLHGYYKCIKYEYGIELGYYVPNYGFFDIEEKDRIVIAWRAIEPFDSEGDDDYCYECREFEGLT